jgi:SpoVK/Ycf46/Vps4 family AAA+-type ATPase
MKKLSIINLIKYYTEGNDSGFRSEAYQIAKEFDETGDTQLSEYIMALLSNANTFIPQINENDSAYFTKVEHSNDPLPLPEVIQEDILGVANAIGHNVGVNKFLFQGLPGTGKTESVKQLARILDRDLFSVDFSSVIDSKLGQTTKNINALFKELNDFTHPEKVIVLFDEIDAIALDRTNTNDIREMGRATSAMLKGFDSLNERVVLIATTNLFEHFDKALVRRFDKVIDFNRYTKQDLCEIGEILLNNFLAKFKFAGKNINLFRKIISKMNPVLYPGDLKNVIKAAIAFSKPGEQYDYLRRLYFSLCADATDDLKKLQIQGFTVREIEILTGVSKSQVSRELKGDADE